jgi:hypothetical protein
MGGMLPDFFERAADAVAERRRQLSLGGASNL